MRKEEIGGFGLFRFIQLEGRKTKGANRKLKMACWQENEYWKWKKVGTTVLESINFESFRE